MLMEMKSTHISIELGITRGRCLARIVALLIAVANSQRKCDDGSSQRRHYPVRDSDMILFLFHSSELIRCFVGVHIGFRCSRCMFNASIFD